MVIDGEYIVKLSRGVVKHNVETMSVLNIETTSYFKVETISYFNVKTTSYFNVYTSDFNVRQCKISTLIRFNKIESLFNVEVRRCFNLYLPPVKMPAGLFSMGPIII